MDAATWEQLRRMTLEELVMFVKLNGSAFLQNGVTFPEGYDFVVVVAVASPGNEAAMQFASEFHAKMTEATRGNLNAHDYGQVPPKKGQLPS